MYVVELLVKDSIITNHLQTNQHFVRTIHDPDTFLSGNLCTLVSWLPVTTPTPPPRIEMQNLTTKDGFIVVGPAGMRTLLLSPLHMLMLCILLQGTGVVERLKFHEVGAFCAEASVATIIFIFIFS